MLQSAICHQQPAVGAGRGSRAAGREAQALGLGSAISFQQTAVSRIQRFAACDLRMVCFRVMSYEMRKLQGFEALMPCVSPSIKKDFRSVRTGSPYSFYKL